MKIFYGWRIVMAGGALQFLQSLLLNQAFGRVHAHEPELADHLFVLRLDQRLEQPERLIWIVAQAQVQPGFVVFELGPANGDALHGLVQRHVKVESQGGRHCERVGPASTERL